MPKLSDGTPYITIGNNELVGLPELGDTIKCWMCGVDHPVEYGKMKLDGGEWVESRNLAFMKCGDGTYICGVGGKEWRPK